VISQGVLLVSGVRGDNGRREMLGVTVADTESEATKTSDGVHLTFFCRYCRTNHWHGAGDDGQAWGHRVSHCHDDRSAYRGPGYVLVPAPGTMDEAERQTIIDSLRTWAERFGKRLVNERSS
jgi:hypothetical protein